MDCFDLTKVFYDLPMETSLRKFVSDIYGLGYGDLTGNPKESLYVKAPKDFLVDAYFAREAVQVPVDQTKPHCLLPGILLQDNLL